MIRLREVVKNHHPYCQETYLERVGKDWSCRCDLLKAYDKWRAKAKKST